MRLKAALAAAAAALSLAACGQSPSGSQAPPSAAPGSPAAGSGPTVAVQLSDFKIAPEQLTAPAGTTTFAVKNEGPTPHNLTIRDSSGKVVAATASINPGQSATLTVGLGPGTYTAFCSLPGHESLGMKDSLKIT